MHFALTLHLISINEFSHVYRLSVQNRHVKLKQQIIKKKKKKKTLETKTTLFNRNLFPFPPVLSISNLEINNELKNEKLQQQKWLHGKNDYVEQKDLMKKIMPSEKKTKAMLVLNLQNAARTLVWGHIRTATRNWSMESNIAQTGGTYIKRWLLNIRRIIYTAEAMHTTKYKLLSELYSYLKA